MSLFKPAIKFFLLLDIVLQAIIILATILTFFCSLIAISESANYYFMVGFIWLGVLGIYQVLSALIFAIATKDINRTTYFFASILVVLGLFALNSIASESDIFKWLMLLPTLMGGFYFYYSLRFLKVKFKKEGSTTFPPSPPPTHHQSN